MYIQSVSLSQLLFNISSTFHFLYFKCLFRKFHLVILLSWNSNGNSNSGCVFVYIVLFSILPFVYPHIYLFIHTYVCTVLHIIIPFSYPNSFSRPPTLSQFRYIPFHALPYLLYRKPNRSTTAAIIVIENRIIVLILFSLQKDRYIDMLNEFVYL